MDKEHKQLLQDSLRSQRLVLLLGQRFLASKDEDNPVFASIDPNVQPSNFYTWWFGTEPSQSIRNELLHARGTAVSIPERFEAIRNLPWTCAFTSCIDPTSRRLLQVDQRRPVAERFQREDNPDYTALPLYRLFGSAGRPDAFEQPPTSFNTLSMRRRICREMLDALSQVTTPHGRLFIEGWSPARDWLRARDLGPALAGFAESQVLIFGLNPDDKQSLRDDEDFSLLIGDATVLLFDESLADAVRDLHESGDLEVVDPRLISADVVEIVVAPRTPAKWDAPGNDALKRVTMSQSDWRALNQSFTVLQPLVVSRTFDETDDERRRSFREFLASSPDMQLDRVREFAFRRSILNDLLAVVLKLILEPSPQDHLVLVAGQSGAGKTALLSLLAVQTREAGLPVVFLRRGVVQPSIEQLDKFIRFVEQATSVATLVIFDGLREEHEYQNMVRLLASRGRKALVVGSTYGTDEPEHKSKKRGLPRKTTVHVDVKMSPKEKEDLVEHLARFTLQDRATLSRLAEAGYDNFFATIYYLLEPARPRLGAGVVREIEDDVQRLAASIRDLAARVEPLSDFQLELRKALGDRLASLNLDENGVDDEIQEQAVRLVNSVMVASRLGVPVPVSIAVRLVNSNHRAYQMALRQTRTIEERDVADEVSELAARTPLEASLWCERRVPQYDEQFALVREMVLQLRPGEAMNDWGAELQFARDLLYAIGPQGRHPITLFYPKIADLVVELRKRCPRISPRLTLIEINATREWISAQGRRFREGVQPTELTADDQQRIVDDWLPRLRQAEQGLEQAIDHVHPPDNSRRIAGGALQLLVTLHTEQACVLGTQQGCLLLLTQPTPTRARLAEIDQCLAAADSAWQQAIRYDDDALYAYDTACWVLRDHFRGLKNYNMDDERKVAILARWEEILEGYRDLSLSEVQYAKMESREADLQRERGDLEEFEQVLERLDQQGTPAASVLRARYIREQHGAAAARTFLEQRCPDQLLTDRTILSFYYRLWWESETGEQGFFDRDHLTLPFHESQWARLRELAEHRLRLDGEQDHFTALFHLGWACLQTAEFTRSREVFDRLDTVSVSSPRRARTLAHLSDENGKPREFFGETRPRRSGDRGWLWAEDLRLEVPFPLREFELGPYRPGRPIGPFHIALNFRGMFAQPTHRYRREG